MVEASPELIASARKYRESAIETLLEAYWSLVNRVALGLCGHPDRAREVIDRVMSRALHAMPKWRDETAADRWFFHYTVLETRRHPAREPGPGDPLLPAGPVQMAEYVAFVRALRGLPEQQQEAIVLNHGEHLNPRYLAVAMDCSAEAAANHLRAGTLQLRAMAGDKVDAMLEEMTRVYKTLAPAGEAIRPEIRRRVRRFLLPRRLRRWLTWIVILLVIAAIWRIRLRFARAP